MLRHHSATIYTFKWDILHDCAYIKSRMNIAPTVAEGPSAAECSNKRPTKPSSPTNNCEEKRCDAQLHDVISISSARNPCMANQMLLNNIIHKHLLSSTLPHFQALRSIACMHGVTITVQPRLSGPHLSETSIFWTCLRPANMHAQKAWPMIF